DRADDEGDAPEEEEPFPHKHRGEDIQREARERDRVRRQSRLDQAVADELAAFSVADRGAYLALAASVGGTSRATGRGVLPWRHLPAPPIRSPGRGRGGRPARPGSSVPG